MVLRRSVYRFGNRLSEKHRFCREHVGQLIDRSVSGVDHAALEEVGVAMSGAGDFPGPQQSHVGLARRKIAHNRCQKVGFRDDRQDRHAKVGPERHWIDGPTGIGLETHHIVAVQRGRSPEPRVDQEAVEDSRNRIDAIDIGHEEPGRLGFADRNHSYRLETPQYAIGRGTADQFPGLRVDIKGERIAGMFERGISFGIGLSDRQNAGHREWPAVEAGVLGRYANIGIAAPNDLAMHKGPVGRPIGAAGDVQPFHDDRAVEEGGVTRPRHDDAATIFSRVQRRRRASGWRRRRQRIGCRGP